MGFPRKRLLFEQVGVDQKLLDELVDLKKFLRGIDDLSASWLKDSGAADRAFLPNAQVLFDNPHKAKVFEATEVARTTAGTNNFNNTLDQLRGCIYKVNAPGFIYREHFKGAFNSNPEYMVLLANRPSWVTKNDVDAIANLPWTLLFRTRGNSTFTASDESTGNNHSNNMFPINPGPNTYLQIITTVKGFGQDLSDKNALMYIPAFGSCTVGSKPLSLVGKYTINMDTQKKREVKYLKNAFEAIDSNPDEPYCP